MKIAVLVFLALLANVKCKSLTRSASLEVYFLPIISNLSSKKDFAGLCSVRKELLETENLNEGRQLIEKLD